MNATTSPKSIRRPLHTRDALWLPITVMLLMGTLFGGSVLLGVGLGWWADSEAVAWITTGATLTGMAVGVGTWIALVERSLRRSHVGA